MVRIKFITYFRVGCLVSRFVRKVSIKSLSIEKKYCICIILILFNIDVELWFEFILNVIEKLLNVFFLIIFVYVFIKFKI